MALSLICTCGARFPVDESFADREVLCPECQSVLRVPATGDVVARVSKLALGSFILALIGAFTVIGTGLAVVLGLVASVRILALRPRLVGLGFALAGIVLGLGFTVLTVYALNGDDLRKLRDVYHEAMLADQLTFANEKDLVIRDGKGFVLKLPTASWGKARTNRIDDEELEALRFRRKPELLLVQPARMLYVDVRKDSVEARVDVNSIRNGYVERMKWDESTDQWGRNDPWGRRRWDMNGKDGPNFNHWDLIDTEEEIESGRQLPLPLKELREQGGQIVALTNEREVLVPDTSGLETVVQATIGGRSWRVIVRFYRLGDTVYIVRGYTQASNFKNNEAELRQVLDSFRLVK